jgi:hypothetical protein
MIRNETSMCTGNPNTRKRAMGRPPSTWCDTVLLVLLVFLVPG